MSIKVLPGPCWYLADENGYSVDPGTHWGGRADAEEKLRELDEQVEIPNKAPILTIERLDKPCAIVECNGCGRAVDDDEFAFVHFPDADVSLAASMARESDFVVIGSDAWCEDCKTNPHEFVEDGDVSDWCNRCNWERDEHWPSDVPEKVEAT